MTTHSKSAKGSEKLYKVQGTLRDQYQQPMPKATIKVYSKGLRGKHLLGETTTDVLGNYSIGYTPKNAASIGIVVGVYDKKTLLKESEVQYNVPLSLQVDLDLSGKTFAGTSEFENLMAAIEPFTQDAPLSELTETEDDQDISFITQKTGLSRENIEKLVMAARFEALTSVPAGTWYGILRQNLPVLDKSLVANQGLASDFITKLGLVLDGLMHTSVDSLMTALQQAIDANILPYAMVKDLADIRKQLNAQIIAYAKKHPVTGQPSALHQKLDIAGLKGKELQSFIEAHNDHTGSFEELWDRLQQTSGLKDSKNLGHAKAVLSLSRLTGNNLHLTEKLVATKKIKSQTDVKALAGYDKEDWEALVKEHKVKLTDEVPGKTQAEKARNYAAQLETSFTKEFPTPSFAARLDRDKKTRLPHKDKVSKFLQDHEHFDLLKSPVGKFLHDNKKTVASKDAPDLADQLRRIQRVYKLAPSYDNAQALLNDNIHSAHQIYKMGEDNFVASYGERMGADQASQIFQKASTVHATATALVGNLKSLSDASAMKAFPDFSKALVAQLTQEVPNLSTLFGHTDYCECDECGSVYGAPAYLTDILHFLNNRLSQLDATNSTSGSRKPSVKDLLFMRRPDLGYIDLECDNTNTEIPYIDIACELMEDFISPRMVHFTGAFTLAKGVIPSALLTKIKDQFTAAGQKNVADLLTASAKVSDTFSTDLLQTDGTFKIRNYWMIRDSQLSLIITDKGDANDFEVRLLHQTFLSPDAIGTGPEYVNVNAYNLIKTAKRPFNLPFDLFETQGELYLEKLGIKKADLIDAFRRGGTVAPGAAPEDLAMAYASLGVNEAEQTLIFQADPTHQSLYWGTAASGTTIQVDLFEQLAGINYSEILNLLRLKFINPAQDSKIEHDDLTSNITTQRVTTLTAAKLDAIHRFLRLWRKTSFSMDELDAIIMTVGQGAINPSLPFPLMRFIANQQALQLSTFQLLAFYSTIDTVHTDCLYNQLFQNSLITSPVNADFSIPQVTGSGIAISDVHRSIIAAVLQISIADVNSLLEKTTHTLTLASLSLVFRHAQLAQALSLSVTDLLKLMGVIDANPFTSPATTALFLQKYKLLQGSGFNVDELNYILLDLNTAAQPLTPPVERILSDLGVLQDELLAVRAATQPVADPNGVLLNKWLSDPAFKWDSSLLIKLLDILNTVDDDEYRQKLTNSGNFLLNLRLQYPTAVTTATLAALPTTGNPAAPIVFPDTIASQLTYDADKKQLRLAGYMSAGDLTALLALSTDAAYKAAITDIGNTSVNSTDSTASNIFFAKQVDIDTALKTITGANMAARYAFFLGQLSPLYRDLQQKDVVIKSISTWFNADKKIASQLLTSAPAVYTTLTADDFVNKVSVNGASIVYNFAAKTCFVAAKLKMKDVELGFVLNNAVNIRCLDLFSLPPAAGKVGKPATTDTTLVTFPGFETLINLFRTAQLFPDKVHFVKGATPDTFTMNFFTIIQGILDEIFLAEETLDTVKSDFQAGLAIYTGLNDTDMGALVNLNFTTLDDFKGLVSFFSRLYQYLTILQQLRASVADIQNWCKASLTADDATKIKQSLKSNYTGSDWLQVAKPIEDSLREKKRDALIAYLLANPGTQTWMDSNDLYSYFLLDVEMCSCQPTSRIVQATNTVQLFVQRCFLALEPSVKVDPADSNWVQWQWMKNFRVWQANMKVFLYPENWIEPELLPEEIKSPFLSELESDLLQNEATSTNVEDAFHSYLEKLSSVARLEIKGQWYDHETKTLHVIARTFGGDPKVYYYRQCINDKRWTPWSKVDLDINSDQIMPAIYNNRLYLFWAVISKTSDTPASITMPKATDATYTPAQPVNKWVIQLAFSEYKNGKWTPKKISNNDDTGKIIAYQSQAPAGQSNYPIKENFLFAPLDIPSFDYSSIFNKDANGNPTTHVDTAAIFNTKAGAAVRRNGKLVINCYYYAFVGNSSFDNCQFVGSFQLDPVKGYPTRLSVPYKIQLSQASSHIERSTRTSNMFNMLDVQSFTGTATPPTNGIPGSNGGKILVAEQGGGAFNNLIPLQMDALDRSTYMTNIYNNGAGATFKIQTPLGAQLPYFFQDQHRTYYIVNEYTDNGAFEFLYSRYLEAQVRFLEAGIAGYNEIMGEIPGTVPQVFVSRYFNFHHPLVDYFTQRLFTNGVDGLMDRETQLKGDFGYDSTPGQFSFQNYFQPVISGFDTIYSGAKLPDVIHNGVKDPTPGYPKDDVDFNLHSGYGLYNWELFFHAPLMIAERLSQNLQFDDADRWYRYIFNPMDMSKYTNVPNKYWVTKPFFLTTTDDYKNQIIDKILNNLNHGTAAQKEELILDVEDWRANPFQPHFIAQFRTVAYQKTAVMKYIGHLIRHGDYLFRQDTMESVNEATQLYILAAEILGPKPELIPPAVETPVNNYSQLQPKLDGLSDALVDVENLMPLQTIKNYNGTTPTQGLPNLQTMYFCIPMNENMAGPTGYWDTVADRLYKIRHCLNIDGTLAPLSLFAPPIDPGMLVRAAAAGIDIGSVLNDMNSPLPLYRFVFMVQKAAELVNEVKSLGVSLLAALEKKDAETLTLMRSGQEIKLQNAVMLLKKMQVKDAQFALDSLNKQKELTTIRRDYYSKLHTDGVNIWEEKAVELNTVSLIAEGGIALGYILSGGLSFIPQITAGISGLGSPVATFEEGGDQIAGAAEFATKTIASIAAFADKAAAITNSIGAYIRRSDEWQFQTDLASKELEQIDKQIAGAQVRLELTGQDVTNQQLQIDQAKETDDFMHSRFTNDELQNWMITKISDTYFKSYQLAYDVAKQSERSFRYELGLPDSAYINFGYWDSLKKGLQAGEQLSYDIRRMEMAYYEQNKRELELTKPISLSQLDPVALLKLKTTKSCFINLPEELFDMDYPGHYMRRIRSVSVTIPCISGPYTTVSCKLTMTKNSIRTSGISSGGATGYPRKQANGVPGDDPRFRDAVGALQSIATSSAQQDSGLFELNFRDERYLPFEGAGAISQWHLELPAAIRQFDYNTISDVIIHLRYTARDGGDTLKLDATASLNAQINRMLVSTKDTGLMRIFSAKNDLPTEWYKFLHPVNAGDDQVLTLNLDQTRFPLFVQGKPIKVKSIEVVSDSAALSGLQIISPAAVSAQLNLTASNLYGAWVNGSAPYNDNPGTWQIKNPKANAPLVDNMTGAPANAVLVNNMVIIVHYEVTLS